MNNKLLLAVFTMGLLTGPIAASAQYDYQQIDYPGQAGTNVWGINDSGDAVGVGFGPDNISFIYASMDGTTTEVAPPEGYLAVSLLAINDAGTLAGSALNLDGITGSGVILSNNGQITVFDHPNAFSRTTFRGVNNKGLATGTYNLGPGPGPTGSFLYDPRSATFTELVPSLFTISHGINSRGTVVGDARFEVDPCGGSVPGQRYGWVRDKDGTVVLFRVNGQRTVARGINDAGMVVGNVADPFTGEQKGYVIEAPETNCASVDVDAADLLQFPGAPTTFPEGITNSGDIVGIFFDVSGSARGFIATEQ